jgi:hypothetical protein
VVLYSTSSFTEHSTYELHVLQSASEVHC